MRDMVHWQSNTIVGWVHLVISVYKKEREKKRERVGSHIYTNRRGVQKRSLL
jgi:dissimilatory sulfite reductase (desulfoviridin) alpha/beta subunit